MRKLFFLTIYLLLFFATPATAQTQLRTNSNTVTTAVGNPPGSSSGDVLSWAQKISSSLLVGSDGLFDVLPSSISNGSYPTDTSNQYECTYLVVDSYNLAGYSGLSKTADGAVVNMIAFFQSNPNYAFLDYYNLSHQTILSQVQPGYAMFLQAVPGQTTLGDDHTAIVKSVNLDSVGNGSIEVYNSNSPATIIKYSVYVWDIVNQGTQKVVGFGFAR